MKLVTIDLSWATLVLNEDDSIDVLVRNCKQAVVFSYKDGDPIESIPGHCFLIKPPQ